MKSKTMTIVAISSLAASSLALTVMLFVGPASASSKKSAKTLKAVAAKYGVINETVDAASDHEILGSTAFPNYTNGAIDNFYSWAHSHVDNSPFAEGTSSPADSGPLGQTAAAGNFSQPQYADARWPGNGGTATFGNQGGPSASSKASFFTATATASEATSAAPGGSSGSKTIAAPKGFSNRLRIALAAWKARWLVPLKLKAPSPGGVTTPVTTVSTPTLPLPASKTSSTTKTSTTKTSTTKTSTTKTSTTSTTPSSSGGDGGGLLESTSVATLDPKVGGLVAGGESSLSSVSIGSGQIVIKHIDVSAKVTNTGTPTDQVAVNIGAATIGGVAVTIDQNGVSVNGQGQNLPYKQADDALNSALKQAGIQLYTVQPEIVKAANQLTITATGVHVKFTQPVDQSGVPAQYFEHILGEVFVDSLAAPAGPVPKFKFSSGGKSTVVSGGSSSSSGGGIVGGSSSSIPGTGGGGSSSYSSPGTSSGSTGTPSESSTPTVLTSALSKPMWLLAAYLVWQALAIATGASLWRWRLGGGS